MIGHGQAGDNIVRSVVNMGHGEVLGAGGRSIAKIPVVRQRQVVIGVRRTRRGKGIGCAEWASLWIDAGLGYGRLIGRASVTNAVDAINTVIFGVKGYIVQI